MKSPNAKYTLVGLGLLFALPLALAWLMYAGVVDFRPGTTSNRGTLVSPPVPVHWPTGPGEVDLESHWVLLYPVLLACNSGCTEALTGLRQVVRALGRDGTRIRVVVLAEAGADDRLSQKVAEIDAEFRVVTGATQLGEQLRDIGEGRGTYIVDPLGNIMMHYPTGANPNDIRLDLDHLLKYGKTDPQ